MSFISASAMMLAAGYYPASQQDHITQPYVSGATNKGETGVEKGWNRNLKYSIRKVLQKKRGYTKQY